MPGIGFRAARIACSISRWLRERSPGLTSWIASEAEFRLPLPVSPTVAETRRTSG